MIQVEVLHALPPDECVRGQGGQGVPVHVQIGDVHGYATRHGCVGARRTVHDVGVPAGVVETSTIFRATAIKTGKGYESVRHENERKY